MPPGTVRSHLYQSVATKYRKVATYPSASNRWHRGDRPPWGHTHTRGTKLTLYSSSSKQTACQVSLGESEFTLRASWHCAAVIDLCIYIFCDLHESSLPLPDIHHPTNCNLTCCFSVILMAGLLFTVEALIWGYAISEFNGTF